MRRKTNPSAGIEPRLEASSKTDNGTENTGSLKPFILKRHVSEIGLQRFSVSEPSHPSRSGECFSLVNPR